MIAFLDNEQGRNAPLFESGRVHATRAVFQEIPAPAVSEMLKRHFSGEWGDVCDGDKAANDLAVKEGERIISIYHFNGKKVYVITEADRSETTICFSSEY